MDGTWKNRGGRLESATRLLVAFIYFLNRRSPRVSQPQVLPSALILRRGSAKGLGTPARSRLTRPALRVRLLALLDVAWQV